MNDNTIIYDKVNDLKKKISLIEWDLKNIDNNETKSKKLETLTYYKLELNALNQKKGSLEG